MSGNVMSDQICLVQIITMRIKSIHEKDRSYLVSSGKVRSGQVQFRSGLVRSDKVRSCEDKSVQIRSQSRQEWLGQGQICSGQAR